MDNYLALLYHKNSHEFTSMQQIVKSIGGPDQIKAYNFYSYIMYAICIFSHLPKLKKYKQNKKKDKKTLIAKRFQQNQDRP